MNCGAPMASRIGPGRGERVQFVLVGEQEELLQLAPKVLTARRVVEGERRQGIQYPEFTGGAAIARLDADDGYDVFGSHAALGGDPLEGLTVIGPELRAQFDPLGRQEVVAVFPPRRDFFGRAGHELNDFGLRLGLGEDGEHGSALERVARDHVIYESDDFGALQVEAAGAVMMQCGSGRLHEGQESDREH